MPLQYLGGNMSFRSKLKMSWLTISLAVVAWVGLTGVGFAQSMNAGDIRGVVTDTSGAILPDVTVTVVNKNTGVTKVLTTNQDGLFDTASIVTGTYEITFSKPGFQTFVRSSLTVNVGDITINAQMTVGAVTEQVIVNTDVPLLSTENAEQSTTLDARQLSQLPQVGQDWQNFVILLPGASGAPMAPAPQGANDPGQVASINGNLPYSTVLADGASVTLPSSANADVLVLDTIQEVKIGTSASLRSMELAVSCSIRSAKAVRTDSTVMCTSIFRMTRSMQRIMPSHSKREPRRSLVFVTTIMGFPLEGPF
jgi:hypothetical protein